MVNDSDWMWVENQKLVVGQRNGQKRSTHSLGSLFYSCEGFEELVEDEDLWRNGSGYVNNDEELGVDVDGWMVLKITFKRVPKANNFLHMNKPRVFMFHTLTSPTRFFFFFKLIPCGILTYSVMQKAEQNLTIVI